MADADWDIATQRLGELIPALEDAHLVRLVASLDAAVEAPADARVRSEARALSEHCLKLAQQHLDARATPISVALLEYWYTLAERLGGSFQSPRLAATWIELVPTESTSTSSIADLAQIEEWLRLAAVVAEHEPDVLSRLGFPGSVRDLLEQLAHEASTTPWRERETGRGELLTHIARLLARMGVCRELLLHSAPQPAVQWWSDSGDEPVLPFDPRLTAEGWQLVARVLRDLEPSV